MASCDDVFVLGVGRTPFDRDAGRSIKTLVAGAVRAALADAGISTGEIGSAYFANAGQGALEGQHMIRGQVALRALGVERIPIINVENACASATTALQLAVTAIRAGEVETALVVGAERLAAGGGADSKAFFSGALDVHSEDVVQSSAPGELSSGNPASRSVFMDIYADLARTHMALHGTTVEQLASVTAKNRAHAGLNPDAQYRSPLSVEQVLAARTIVWPLTLPMCAPLGNGAAAAVVCSGSILSRIPAARPVRVAAIQGGTGSTRHKEDEEEHIVRRLAQGAYERAGMGPEDVSVAEVHDATAAGEILQTECLGLVPRGYGGSAAAAGETSLGGRLPVNPSGGLECNGHPIGATGLAQVHEVVQQLRGAAGPRQVPDARIGLVENGGGFIGVEEAVATVALFERWSPR